MLQLDTSGNDADEVVVVEQQISFPSDHEAIPQSQETATPDNTPISLEGLSKEAQLLALHQRTGAMTKDISQVLEKLKAAMQEATDITYMHIDKYVEACEEVRTVVDANLGAAKRIQARTQGMVESIDDLKVLEKRLAQLDRSLGSFERLADAILK